MSQLVSVRNAHTDWKAREQPCIRCESIRCQSRSPSEANEAMNSSDCATARGKVGCQVSWSVPSPDAVRHVVGSVILWPASQEVKSILS